MIVCLPEILPESLPEILPMVADGWGPTVETAPEGGCGEQGSGWLVDVFAGTLPERLPGFLPVMWLSRLLGR